MEMVAFKDTSLTDDSPVAEFSGILAVENARLENADSGGIVGSIAVAAITMVRIITGDLSPSGKIPRSRLYILS